MVNKATILFLLLYFYSISFSFAQSDKVVVNEVFFGEQKGGWVELKNTGVEPAVISDVVLWFDDAYLNLPNHILDPLDFLIVEHSFEVNKRNNQTYSPTIQLVQSDANVIHHIPSFRLGDYRTLGLGESTGNFYLFEDASPGKKNLQDGIKAQLSPPQFSLPAGFYQESVQLELSTVHQGATIRYTLDGSTPTESSPTFSGAITLTNREGDPNTISMIPTNQFGPGHPYNEEWQEPAGEVKKLNIIRARVFFSGAEPSDPTTSSYLIHPEVENRFSFPVISISTDPENFFDNDIGIYVWGNNNNYNQRGEDWERPVFFEFFEADGSLGFAQQLGARIHGGTSRSRPRKSLRMYARSDYGQSWVNYQLFPDKQLSQFKRFILRNSGNDWDRALFRDAFMQNLVKDLDLDIQYSRPTIVFINGEYWGIHNIRDRFDTRYIETHYGLSEDEFTMMENNSVFDSGNEAGVAHYNQMRSFINNPGVSSTANYEHVKTLMDVDNFTDYQIAQIYFRNTDWPGNNLQYWRSFNDYNPDAPYGLDGRWRWMLFDTDFGFNLDFNYVQGHPAGPAHNTLSFALQTGNNNWPNPDWSTFLLRRLVTNNSFRTGFINRFADLLNTNFREDVVLAKIDSLEALYIPEMVEHIQRWRRPVTVTSWQETLDSMRDFGQQRPGFMRQFIMQQFNIPGTYQLSLNVNEVSQGYIQINRTDILPTTAGVTSDAYPWSGTYFRSVPVTVTAQPRTGFRFVQWQGASTSSSPMITINPSGNATLTAIFEPMESDEGEITPWNISQSPYFFTSWSASEEAGTYPPSMKFYQTNTLDPRINDDLTEPWVLPYNLTNRSRINGLGADGFAFINTGNAQEDGGGFLGTAVLALNTLDADRVEITWRGGTVTPNSRVYHIRLQYRIGGSGEFEDVLNAEGQPVEYVRNEQAGHNELIGPILLPEAALNRSYVELRWKYYYTGIRLNEDSGARDQLRITDIFVNSGVTENAIGLTFGELSTTAQTDFNTPPILVRALNEDGFIDPEFNGDVTLSVFSGPGLLSGTTTLSASSGEVTFTDISFSEPGVYVLRAESNELNTALSQEIRVVRLVEVLLPQFIQGAQPDNNERIPFAFRVRIEGLLPNASYRYYNRVIDENDPWNQNGGGNAIFVNTDGGDFIRTTESPRFRGTDFGTRHYTFTTDPDGMYEGWFVTEPSGNNRFTPNNLLRMRILLNNGQDGEELYHFIDTPSEVRVLEFGDITGFATGFVGISTGISKNFMALYDNTAGNGRPLSISFVEQAGFQSDERYAEFYNTMVNGIQGNWGAIIPNDLTNGIRRIEEFSLLDGFSLSNITNSDGVWPGTGSTINPSGGMQNPIIINLEDAVPIEMPEEVPAEFTLSQNYPNPFNPTTQISYGIPEPVHVRLEVYSINGQLITVLQNGIQSAGYHTVTFDSRNGNLASGVYLYRLEAGTFVQVKKMLLVK